MSKHLLTSAILICLTLISYAQPTNIYQPSGTPTFGRATNDSLNYYINLGHSPFSVKRIDNSNTITQVCDLPAMTNQMLFNNDKGIYKTSSGFSLYDGSSHSAIPTATLPATYPFNAINEDFFHIGTNTYFQNGKDIFKTNFSSVSSIQTLYTSTAAVLNPTYCGITKMYNTGNSIYFVESGDPFIPNPNLLKRIDLSTGNVTTLDTIASSALGIPKIVRSNSLYYSVGSSVSHPFGKVKKVDDNGVISTLYAVTNSNNSILSVLGVLPSGVVCYTSQNILVLISGGTITPLNFNIPTSPLPRVSFLNGKSTNTLVYFQAYDSLTVSPPKDALWVTDGTLTGTKKVISKNDYYSGAASFGDANSSVSSVVCGDDLYFPGQKTVSSQLNLFYVNGSNYTYTINTSFNSVQQLYKNPNGGIYMKGSPVLGQFAVYKTNCSGINSVEELSSNTIIFDLFPNPSNGKITIKLEENINNCILTVYSVLGEVLSHKTISGQSTDLDLNLKTGLYFISINSKGQKATKKIIVE
ncbi:MAG: T9SS type A sorting domain-containing protein [Bacteroidetes bacterium]|nr:T9SS type A sorting domain-containing protein [Bacteroidota bacterium]